MRKLKQQVSGTANWSSGFQLNQVMKLSSRFEEIEQSASPKVCNLITKICFGSATWTYGRKRVSKKKVALAPQFQFSRSFLCLTGDGGHELI